MDGQGEIASAAAPKLMSMSNKERIDKQDTARDKSIDLNIEQVSGKVYLSPKQIENFKGKAKKGTMYNLPQSQMNTRRLKGSSYITNQ